MPKKQVSDSADQETDSNASSGSASEEVETPRKIRALKRISDYEKQRMKRIEENKARMLSLGLKKMANSFENSIPKESKKTNGRKDKGKRKVVDGEDEEYMPSKEEEEEGFGSSSSEDENGGGDNDEDFDLVITKKKKVHIAFSHIFFYLHTIKRQLFVIFCYFIWGKRFPFYVALKISY